jgi:hypothetical protein
MRSFLTTAIAAASLLASSTAMAAAQPGQIAARTGADLGESEEIAGTFMIIGLVVVLAIIAAFVIFDDDDEDLPASP